MAKLGFESAEVASCQLILRASFSSMCRSRSRSANLTTAREPAVTATMEAERRPPVKSDISPMISPMPRALETSTCHIWTGVVETSACATAGDARQRRLVVGSGRGR